jgi:proteasome accessory factor A
MHRAPCDRIFGLETEFGTLVAPGVGTPEQVVALVKDQVFYEDRLGLIDLHSRDEVFEPAESGGFLLNGGRLYIDAVGSHLEYATAECRSLKDLVAHDRAGHRIIVRALDELGLSDKVDV